MQNMVDDSFALAAALLPQNLRKQAQALPPQERECAEELRLRAGRPPTVVTPSGERVFSQQAVDQQTLRTVLDIATGSSVHTVSQALASGSVTVHGGLRIGVVGSAIVTDGRCSGFRSISGLCIRIPHQKPGVGQACVDRLGGVRRFPSALIISPPGWGKTTLLRDIVRILSEGGRRVSLCDERGEIAAMYGGVPQMDVGPLTDVIEGCPRNEAMTMMIRAMAPQVLAVDEITAAADAGALMEAAGCGVTLLATAHAADVEDLRSRTLYSALVDKGIFRAVISIELAGGQRTYRAMQMR